MGGIDADSALVTLLNMARYLVDTYGYVGIIVDGELVHWYVVKS